MPRYMVSIIGDEAAVANATPEDMERIVSAMGAYNDDLRKADVLVDADGLGPTADARTLRWGEEGKPVATDGPFAESKEQIAGFWVFRCKDLDEAAEWAAKAPVGPGSALEVRPIAETAAENFEAYKDAADR